MPTVEIKRKLLLERLGKDKSYKRKQFADLCFDFGIELDEVTSQYEQILHENKVKYNKLPDKVKKNKKKLFQAIPELKDADTEELYKIDVPANRYDLLCVEGLTRALRIFGLTKDKKDAEKHPCYRIINADDEKSMITFKVISNNCNKIRPYAVGAILRNIDLSDDVKFDSFMKLQEKLHFNICRKRELVAIGTHDLDTITPPFLFDARPPHKITFKALKESKERTAKDLFEWYKSKDYQSNDGNPICAVKEYLHLIDESAVYPIIYDDKDVVLSMPPIINGEHSKITQKTKNIFIESTATDLTKANIVLNTIICMFSEYCAEQFTCEAVKLIYVNTSEEKEIEEKSYITPNFDSHRFETSVEYINKNLGTKLTSTEIVSLLYRMGLEIEAKGDNKLFVSAPPTRSDILHPVDIVEDVAIAYGYNNITFRLPTHATTGKEFILNSVSDKIREVVAACGYIEVLNWVLISREENFKFMRIDEKEKENMVVRLSKPKHQAFEICRTNLLPGIFKTLSANIGQKNISLPLHIFEVGDVVLCDVEYEVGARNEKRLAAVICNRQNSGLEYIHGLLDRIMEQNQIRFLPQIELEKKYKNIWPNIQQSKGQRYYSISKCDKPSFLKERQAQICVDGKVIGYFGIIHPEILKNFEISTFTPCIVSALEINVECFVQRSKSK